MLRLSRIWILFQSKQDVYWQDVSTQQRLRQFSPLGRRHWSEMLYEKQKTKCHAGTWLPVTKHLFPKRAKDMSLFDFCCHKIKCSYAWEITAAIHTSSQFLYCLYWSTPNFITRRVHSREVTIHHRTWRQTQEETPKTTVLWGPRPPPEDMSEYIFIYMLYSSEPALNKRHDYQSPACAIIQTFDTTPSDCISRSFSETLQLTWRQWHEWSVQCPSQQNTCM